MSKFVTLHGFGGGNGTDLNFEVVGGTTQPINPKENTIWVNTDVEISEYKFSSTEPITPVENMIWIKTGVDSKAAFDIVDGATLYPLFVKQYINSVWTDISTMVYKNGEWINMKKLIYSYGDECTDISGGWVGGAKAGSPPSNFFVKNSDHLYLDCYNKTVPSTVKCWANNIIDFTGYSILRAIVTVVTVHSTNDTRIQIAGNLADAQTPWGTPNALASVQVPTGNRAVVEVDVSDINTEGYICFCIASGASPIRIYEVELI